ncbi:VWA domain-containing protein [candidate division KSB1 bacterium]|nr:VWA domain-containing protein [candidate division KSB1 bacterium]
MQAKIKIVCLLSVFLLVFHTAVYGDGFIVPQSGINISVKYHHVNVTITDQVAFTEVDQVFVNDSDMDNQEAIYVFPLPKGASFTDFSMIVDGEELHAEMLDADSAREFYEQIVRQHLDPALLEYVGQNLFRARIFPINAHAERRVKILYNEIINYDTDLYRYVYPLNTEKYSANPLEDVSVNVTIKTSRPMKSIFSPSHTITVQKSDDYNASVNYSEEQIKPDIDFILYYTTSADEIGMNVMTHHLANEDGFYLFLASPKYSIDESQVIAKRIFFVIDRSGSMSGEKIVQAKDALKFCVTNLNPSDYFNIIDFSSEITSFQSELLEATPANIQSALGYISTIDAGGGTNINDALQTALKGFTDESTPNIIIFLTDGQPTVGETDNAVIRNNVKTANTHGARLFSFGVGYDVNSTLLDQLAEENNGITTYVSPTEDIEIAVSAFFTKVNNPILTNLSLDYGAIQTYDYFPKKLPDLFKGSQLLVIGRFQNSGSTMLSLQGEVNGIAKTYQYQTEFPATNPENDFLPRLWATRKIGYLLDTIRLEGENQELIDEIIVLGKKYGIITPYTSFLIYEDVPDAGNWDELAYETGPAAFDNAVNNGRYRNAYNTNNVRSANVRYAGDKTFFERDSFWVDSQLDESLPFTDIEFASDRYFEIIANNSEIARYFSVGKNVIVAYNNEVYRVHDDGELEITVPQVFRIRQNYPNPFNSTTKIRFTMYQDARVDISIYNLLGEKIAELYDNFVEAGNHEINWDTDGCASGIYLCCLRVGRFSAAMKMTLLR